MIFTNLRTNGDSSPLRHAAFEAVWSVHVLPGLALKRAFWAQIVDKAYVFRINLKTTAISVYGIHRAFFVMQVRCFLGGTN